jgi:O-antigen ligase
LAPATLEHEVLDAELVREAPPPKLVHKLAQSWREPTEFVMFWLFVAGLAWVPFWYGSNDLLPWGVNALFFPGLAVTYEVSVLARGKSHPVAIKELWIPAALFVAVVLWIIVQNATWTPASWQHPIWLLTADALEKPIEGSISVNRDLTTLALVRLITAASVFWLAVQLCRDLARAHWFIAAIAAIGVGYAGYGLVFFGFASGPVAWFGNTATRGFVTSTFFNHNHYATYAGIGLIAICGLILRLYRNEVTIVGGSVGFTIASIIEASAKRGAFLLVSAFLIFVALLLTGSRGGILATSLGLAVLGLLWFGQRNTESTEHRKTVRSAAIFVVLTVLVLGAAVISVFGDSVFGKISEAGLRDDNRLAVYFITLRSILTSPWLGYGYGTFADVFPMFRDRSIDTFGFWEQAHNTYLEVFEGLGVMFGSMLVASVVLLVWKCLIGAVARRKGAMVCCVATSAAFLVGVHVLVDFSLQMQAVALTLMAIVGAGVAQSKSSRLALND